MKKKKIVKLTVYVYTDATKDAPTKFQKDRLALSLRQLVNQHESLADFVESIPEDAFSVEEIEE